MRGGFAQKVEPIPGLEKTYPKR